MDTLLFRSDYISSYECLSGERIMVTCCSHPYYGDDVIFLQWPRDKNANKILIGERYIDHGHVLSLEVTVISFSLDSFGELCLYTRDVDGHERYCNSNAHLSFERI